jgi:hypothetical protein
VGQLHKNLGVVERIILKWISNRMEGCELDSSVSGSCEHCNKPSGLHKTHVISALSKNAQFLKKESDPWN